MSVLCPYGNKGAFHFFPLAELVKSVIVLERPCFTANWCTSGWSCFKGYGVGDVEENMSPP